MIYLTTVEGQHVLIVESGNLDRLRGGKPMVTPDRQVMVAYTPDMKFTENAPQDMLTTGMLDAKVLDDVLQMSLKREVVRR